MSDMQNGATMVTGIASPQVNGAGVEAPQARSEDTPDRMAIAPEVNAGPGASGVVLPPIQPPPPNPTPATAPAAGSPPLPTGAPTSATVSNARAASLSAAKAPKAAGDVTTDRQSAIPTAAEGASMQDSMYWVHRRQAGVVSRGLAFVIDVVLVVVAAALIYYLTSATLSLLRVDINSCTTFMPLSESGSLVNNLCRATRGAVTFASLMVAPVYFTLLWLLGGQTIGMYVSGVRVVRTNGKPLKLRIALLRLVGMAGSLLVLGLGLLWCVVDSNRQGWHDKLAGTYVIYWRRKIAYKEATGAYPERRGGRLPEESSPE